MYDDEIDRFDDLLLDGLCAGLLRRECFFGCHRGKPVGSASSDAIEVNLLHTDVDTIAYSAFVDSIEYIPLETTEECLVGEVTDVVMAGDPIRTAMCL